MENLFNRRLIMPSYYLQTSRDALVKMCHALVNQLPSHVPVISRASVLATSLSLDDILCYSQSQLKSSVCDAQQEKMLDGLCAKPLHSKFYNWTCFANVSMERNFQWLQQSLHSESESTLFAFQNQVIFTSVYQAKIIRSHISVLCRLCGEQEETIQHVWQAALC